VSKWPRIAKPGVRGCHSQMDQLGFALENFDAIGEWRDIYASGTPVDASGQLPDGSSSTAPSSLRRCSASTRINS